jgi:hypothetical protein
MENDFLLQIISDEHKGKSLSLRDNAGSRWNDGRPSETLADLCRHVRARTKWDFDVLLIQRSHDLSHGWEPVRSLGELQQYPATEVVKCASSSQHQNAHAQVAPPAQAPAPPPAKQHTAAYSPPTTSPVRPHQPAAHRSLGDSPFAATPHDHVHTQQLSSALPSCNVMNAPCSDGAAVAGRGAPRYHLQPTAAAAPAPEPEPEQAEEGIPCEQSDFQATTGLNGLAVGGGSVGPTCPQPSPPPPQHYRAQLQPQPQPQSYPQRGAAAAAVAAAGLARGDRAPLCAFCQARPAYVDPRTGQQHPYCGRSCASQADLASSSQLGSNAAPMCTFCGTRPAYVEPRTLTQHPYCGKSCASRADAAGWRNGKPPAACGYGGMSALGLAATVAGGAAVAGNAGAATMATGQGALRGGRHHHNGGAAAARQQHHHQQQQQHHHHHQSRRYPR